MKKLTLLVLFALALTGCQSLLFRNASDMDKLNAGMNKEQVVRILGEPSVIAVGRKDPSEIEYVYPRASDSGLHNYVVVFKNDKLVRYGRE